MDYEIDKQYKFPVKEKKISNGALFYVISANGFDCEVKAFESQRGTNPTSIICLFKGYKDDNEPIFRQDFAVLISQIYKVGEVYEFKVKNDINAFDYYEVTDKNGFIFRLVDYGKTKIYTNQIVKAKVKSINRIKVEVSLVTNKKAEGLLFMQPDDIWELYELGKLPTRYLNLLLFQAPLLKGAISDYKDGNALWVIHTIDAIDKHLPDWLNAEYPKHKLRSLSAYHCICLNLLEKSEYLKNCTEEERVMYQKKIATALTHAEDYIVALNLMTEQREQDYIDDHLERLKNTGYLYNPEKTMRVIMSLFTMRQKSVQDYIQDIFDIISNGHDNERFMTQFRQAFTEMLDVYIWNEVKEVNLIPKIYNAVSKQRIEEMVEALAIQLLLLEGIDHEDKSLYRSMLYRFASIIKGDERLINKSYLSLISRKLWPIEYGWADLEKKDRLCVKLCADVKIDNEMVPLLFHGNNTSIALSQGSITISPISQIRPTKKAYPDGITPWNKIQFLLDERMGAKVTPNTSDINRFKLMWNELERSLFAPKTATSVSKAKKRKASVGDKVKIRVIRQNPASRHEFFCKIEDDYYEGDGILDARKIVHYNVNFQLALFRDKETQAPFILKATAEKINDNGKLVFSMMKEIENFVYETTETGGDDVLAQVTLVEPTYYLCVTELGYALSISKSETTTELKKGDFIWTEIENVKTNGNVSAHYRGLADEDFKLSDGFYSLIHDYADGNLYQEIKDETVDEDAILSETYVDVEQIEELIHIIDRYAMTLESDHTATYNYLEVSKILSRIIQNEQLVAYYDKRMKLVRELQKFSELQRMPQETLDELLKENEEFVSNYPDIKDRLTQLRIISHLDKDWNVDFLWDIAKSESNTKCGDVARLVLAHNLLKGFNAYDQQKAISKRLFQTMDLDMQLPETSFVAEEDEVTELKTSMIFPADNKGMKADEKKQIKELLTVVCSMLNSKGGTLYVGVNNMGFAVGIEPDFDYLSKTPGRYDLTQMKDQYDLKFRNNVHDQLGVIANDLVSSSFFTVEGKTIYKVDVLPSKDIIYLDKIAYIRQGTSKWPVDSTKMAALKAQRERIFSKD